MPKGQKRTIAQVKKELEGVEAKIDAAEKSKKSLRSEKTTLQALLVKLEGEELHKAFTASGHSLEDAIKKITG